MWFSESKFKGLFIGFSDDNINFYINISRYWEYRNTVAIDSQFDSYTQVFYYYVVFRKYTKFIV